MAEWSTVISLVVFGLVLVVAEVIFVPGTTVVGIIGFCFLVVGVGLSFKYFGSEVGWVMLGTTSVACGGLLYFSFTTNMWSRFSLKSSNKSKVNEGELDQLLVGMEGTTISALRPIGKAELNNQIVEVKTNGDYLDSGSRIRVIKIVSNQIIIEPIN
ncbi:MAG: NfeD family protein [Cytophagales bacterium]|jgi:membrane-bound ClpP family serine protease|nr:NfeD family protein [Cytophagales bacterium]MCA6365587.1 NfeD family protein [Cytophagales bacterium]MCA6372530.1 NfeD family protein [Cytophagales bacterium]MCA6374306.1 NfeD family protein [Cytophagales bacterium]MCA6383191.1 NfeD family protein [Cytophagales bacterium]